MNEFVFMESLNYLDSDLLEHHLKIKMAKNRGRAGWKARLKLFKPMLVAGLIAFVFVIGIISSSLAYPQIDLINSTEGITIRYIPKWVVSQRCLKHSPTLFLVL